MRFSTVWSRNFWIGILHLLFVKQMLLVVMLMPLSAKADTEVSVLTYNVYMRWPQLFFPDDHDRRARLIPDQLRGHDLVVLQEAFSDSHRDQMLLSVADEYPDVTDRLGENEFFSHNGGVVILSRWPIVKQAQHVFEGCDGSDCMVKKGVVYAKVDLSGTPVHLFGLHLQAQKEYAAARIGQFAQIRTFIDAQNIPPDELVLVAGDFNVDYHSDDTDGEYGQLIQDVGLSRAANNLEATYESGNSFIAEPVSERLDYVFYSTNHLTPDEVSSRVHYFREGDQDLSDHHPVVGRFRISHDQD